MRNTNFNNTHTWNKNVPFKASFLLWRELRSKLPTNERIANFGSELVKGSCCRIQEWDDIDHIFIFVPFANHIWAFFSILFGFNHMHLPLKNHLMNWWGLETKNRAHKMLIQALPIFISWNLWKSRCASKYGGRQLSIPRVKIEGCSQEVQIKEVRWMRPLDTIFKLNTDGNFLKNPDIIGGGGILRDSLGKMVYAFTIPLGVGTNNRVETLAAIHGLQWCVQHGYKNIILKVDSELLTKWIAQNIKPP
ncbi:hypothetical protein KY285_008066 [Solanum tuberosum]|nr:hypothetical protein KY285_008066 [Solanum tuberosum]